MSTTGNKRRSAVYVDEAESDNDDKQLSDVNTGYSNPQLECNISIAEIVFHWNLHTCIVHHYHHYLFMHYY